VLLARTVTLVLLVPPEPLDLQEREARQDPLGPQDSRVCPDLRE